VPIEEIEIGPEHVQHLLAREEGHFSDLKAIEIKPAKLTRSMSAFANADGGELYIGIDEDQATRERSWRGFNDQEAANGHLQAFDEFFPMGEEVEYSFLRSADESGIILHAIVHKSRELKKASGGMPYTRRGAQNIPVKTPEQLDLLRRAKGITSYETNTVAAPVEELTNSEVIIGFMLEIIPEGEPETWLKKQRLILDERPTVAGLLLFADEPQIHLPKASVKIYRYKTTNLEGTRETLTFNPISIEGCAYEVVRAAVAKTTELIEEIEILGPEGLESVSYPRETLHEIITNGVLHRDYAIADDVHVRIFDNRVEVESPGPLPAHITPKNILRERFARNGLLVRLINKFPDPPNKDVGEGLNTAFQAMRTLRLKDPLIEQQENSVLVSIRHETLASPEKMVMEYLDHHADVNNAKVRAFTSIDSEYKVRRILKRLIDSGEIEKVPGKQSRATAYRRREHAERGQPSRL
jgi:ATP-dependent DNA helicase RecG